MPLSASDVAILFASAVGAGGMNALAGGGTVLTFPTLLLLGIPAISANATSTVALLPGAAASFAGYRREVATHRHWLPTLLVPSLLGGACGSTLLLLTPERIFARLAPWLVLFATLLFAAQWLRSTRGATAETTLAPPDRAPGWAWLGQFAIAVYGGYFGAGIGILMLVVLGAFGLRDIHAMNGLKNFFGFCINGVAAAIFVVSGRVAWIPASIMIAGAIAGGFAGAHFGRYLGQRRVRLAVILIGILLASLLFLRRN
ncbi:MAG: sulfite exporter TauE/SafE family protein [Thermoanaerobaculia bacterium]